MKTRRILLGLLTLIVQAHATWTLIQHPGPAASCGTQTCAVPLTQNTGANHVIVIMETYIKTVSGVTITSVSGGGTYTIPAGCSLFVAGRTEGVNCAVTLASTSGAGSISITQSAATTGSFFNIREYSFTGSSVSIDNTGTGSSPGICTSCAGVALTLTGTNDLIAQFLGNASSNIVTAISAPYTTLDGDNGDDGYANALNTTNGAAPTWTLALTGGQVVVGAIAVQEVGGNAGISKWKKLEALCNE